MVDATPPTLPVTALDVQQTDVTVTSVDEVDLH
jgi:hypothetical protein